MPGTTREGAKEDDSGINPGHLRWKINQREGVETVVVGSVHSLPQSVAPHESASLCKPGSRCPAPSWGAGQAEGRASSLTVRQTWVQVPFLLLYLLVCDAGKPKFFSDCFFISKMRITKVLVCRVAAERGWSLHM